MNRLTDLPAAAGTAAPSIARDPFALELIKNALVALADEMALTVYRTARSFVVKEALDFSTALFLADGQLIAQGTCLPFHLGAMPFAVKAVTRAYAGRILPGDLYITNDPYDGSTHLPDIVLVKPIFHDGQLAGFSVARISRNARPAASVYGCGKVSMRLPAISGSFACFTKELRSSLRQGRSSNGIMAQRCYCFGGFALISNSSTPPAMISACVICSRSRNGSPFRLTMRT